MGALDFVDHLNAKRFHAGIERINVQDTRGQVVDVGAANAADIRGYGRYRFESTVPIVVNRFGREFEGCGCEFEQTVCRLTFESTITGGAVGKLQELLAKQLAIGKELAQVPWSSS